MQINNDAFYLSSMFPAPPLLLKFLTPIFKDFRFSVRETQRASWPNINNNLILFNHLYIRVVIIWCYSHWYSSTLSDAKPFLIILCFSVDRGEAVCLSYGFMPAVMSSNVSSESK